MARYRGLRGTAILYERRNRRWKLNRKRGRGWTLGRQGWGSRQRFRPWTGRRGSTCLHPRVAARQARTRRVWIITSLSWHPCEHLSLLRILHRGSVPRIHRAKGRVPCHLTDILFRHLFPNTVSRDLESLTLILDCHPSITNVRNLCRPAPPGRAPLVGPCIRKYCITNFDIRAIEGLILRQKSAQFASGHLLESGRLRHLAEFPSLYKLP